MQGYTAPAAADSSPSSSGGITSSSGPPSSLSSDAIKQPTNLQLCVKNTFLHVRDVVQNPLNLRRSQSDSSISHDSTSSSQLSHTGFRDGEIRGKASNEVGGVPYHYVNSGGLPPSLMSQGIDPPEPNFGNEGQYGPAKLPVLGGFWSAGSELHDIGQCEPCAWHWRAKGCVNEINCGFCHACPAGTLKRMKREKKGRAAAMAAGETAKAAPIEKLPDAQGQSKTVKREAAIERGEVPNTKLSL